MFLLQFRDFHFRFIRILITVPIFIFFIINSIIHTIVTD